jgi:predicted Fe-S protein YdhL (DUF1289 family)
MFALARHDGLMADATADFNLSPCVLVCVIDDATDLCRGCHRTVGEVAAWIGLDDAARAAIMADLPGRRARTQA